MGEVAALGATLGSGTLIAAGARAGWGARALLWADRVAFAIETLGSIISEHRGWILENFGDDGKEFLDVVDLVNSVVAIYGFTQGSVSFLKELSIPLKSVCKRIFKSTNESQLPIKDIKVMNKIEEQTDDLIQRMDSSMENVESADSLETMNKMSLTSPNGPVSRGGVVDNTLPDVSDEPFELLSNQWHDEFSQYSPSTSMDSISQNSSIRKNSLDDYELPDVTNEPFELLSSGQWHDEFLQYSPSKGGSNPINLPSSSKTDLSKGTGNKTDRIPDGVIRDGSHMGTNGALKPNVKYKAGEYEYLYETDNMGRLKEFNADDLKLTERDSRLPHKSNTPGKETDDHAGHLAGDRFGGSPDLDNLVSQSSNVNVSKYKKLENKWAKAIEKRKKVSVNVKVNYEGTGLRPTSFEIEYKIDGEIKIVELRG